MPLTKSTILAAVNEQVEAARRVMGAERPRGMPEIPDALVGGPFEEITTDVGTLWAPIAHRAVEPRPQVPGTRDEATGALLRSVMYEKCRFLDVGANIGYYSSVAGNSEPGVSIDAVEPLPVLFGILKANLWSNRVIARTWGVALGAGRGLRRIPSGCHATATVPAEPGDLGAPSQTVVPVISADELFAGRTFDVVKINAGGAEPEIVLGMQRILQESPGIILLVEFGTDRVGEEGLEPAEVLARYRAMGFDLSVHDGRGLGNCDAADVIEYCTSGGPRSRVTLVLRRR